MRRGFTIIELMVVLTIIMLVTSLAAPSIGKLLASNQRARAVQTLDALLVQTQATARSQFTPAALRIERAFRVDDEGQMITDAAGEPDWLDHQQARVLTFGSRHGTFPVPGEELAFRQVGGTDVTALPSLVWLAPDYAVSPTFGRQDLWREAEPAGEPVNGLDTFHIVFNRRGELVELPASGLVYLDETQGNRFVSHPYPSVRSLVAYDRELFGPQNEDFGYLSDGLPIHINRYTGSVIRPRERE